MKSENSKILHAILRHHKNGVLFDQLAIDFSFLSKNDLNLMILDEIKSGQLWVYAGRYFSQKHYKNFVIDEFGQ